MSSNLGSEQDELYYFAKNFNKLKFSNQAYIDSTQKQKNENEKEIEKLKKDYEKLRNDVNTLKKTSLYIPGRVKSAADNKIFYYRGKLDLARHEKFKSKEMYKKYCEKYNELKSEAKLIRDDNNPYVKRIKLLENKLDKAMIKYNESMSIRRTYEQILARLKSERAGYDNQIAAIQKSIKSKIHDLNEFKLLLQDSKQARMYSELLLKNTQLSKTAFEEHFEQLIQAHKKENLKEFSKDKTEGKKKQKHTEIEQTIVEEKQQTLKENTNLDKIVKDLEEKDKLVRETTGADDINEICQKFSNLIETKENLKKEKKDLEKTRERLKLKKEELIEKLNIIKYNRKDEISRKEIEEQEKNVEENLNLCKASQQKLTKQKNLFVNISAGIDNIIDILSHKNFEIAIENGIICDDSNEVNEKKFVEDYKELLKLEGKDLYLRLEKLNKVLKIIEKGCSDLRKNAKFNMETSKLNRKEENEIENIYIGPQEELDKDDEYEQEDDIAQELPTNKGNMKKTYDRPFSAFSGKNSRISITAKNK